MPALRQPGLVTVARHAGVSVGTVSNTINQPHLVSPAMRARVEAAINELGFVPNRAAADLRRGSNRLLGLVIPDVINPFYAAIVDAVVEAADHHRYTVSLCVSHEDTARERRHFELLAQQRAAGALVVPIEADPGRLAKLRKVGTRLILVDRLADPTDGCSVAIDDALGGKLATQHLLRCEGTGITLVNGPRGIPQCDDRRNGSRTALDEAGLNPNALVEVEAPEMSVEAGLEAGRRIAAAGLPLRIFCINDQLARGVIEGLSEFGISVPQHASVVGYGDLALPSADRLLLSTIGQPKREMGKAAVEKLLEELHDGQQHVHSSTVFPPHLLVRDTTAHNS